MGRRALSPVVGWKNEPSWPAELSSAALSSVVPAHPPEAAGVGENSWSLQNSSLLLLPQGESKSSSGGHSNSSTVMWSYRDRLMVQTPPPDQNRTCSLPKTEVAPPQPTSQDHPRNVPGVWSPTVSRAFPAATNQHATCTLQSLLTKILPFSVLSLFSIIGLHWFCNGKSPLCF